MPLKSVWCRASRRAGLDHAARAQPCTTKVRRSTMSWSSGRGLATSLAQSSSVAVLVWMRMSPPRTAPPYCYAYGVSGCASNRICGASNTLQICCTGVVSGPGNDTHVRRRHRHRRQRLLRQLGQRPFCSNNGQGNCGTGGRCNGNADNCTCGAGSLAPTYFPHTCGGYGATCTAPPGARPAVRPATPAAARCVTRCAAARRPARPASPASVTGSTSTCRKTCSDDTPCPKMTTCNTGAGYCS